MPIGIEDARRILTNNILRRPRKKKLPMKKDGPRQQPDDDPIRVVQNQLGIPWNEYPVNGVGVEYFDKNKGMIVLFSPRPYPGLLEVIREIFPLRGIEIANEVAGVFRPTSTSCMGGESIGEASHGGKSGSAGMLVEDVASNRYMLTCHHTLGTLNKMTRGSSEAWHPSTAFGGALGDEIGWVADYHDIHLGGTTENEIDAAIVEPRSNNLVASGLKKIGTISGTAAGLGYGEKLKKYGPKTKETSGKFRFKMDFICHYPEGDALFVKQLGIVAAQGQFGTEGDSGSIVVNSNNECVGLLIAEADGLDISIASPIGPVLDHFNVWPV